MADDVCGECGHFWKDHTGELRTGCCAATYDDGELFVCQCNKWLDENGHVISAGITTQMSERRANGEAPITDSLGSG